MFGNGVVMTTATGGTGALTLSAVTGSPGYANVFGGSGARWVDYDLVEYTDATRAQVGQAETGIGTLDLGTLSLTRTKVLATWAGGVYDNIAPTALSLGTTAANIRVRCGPTAAHDALNMPWVLQSVGDGIGIPGLNLAVAAGTATMTGNTAYYVPFLWPVSAEVNQASIDVTTRVIGGSGVIGAVYEVQASFPGRKLSDLATSGTPFANSGTGIKSLTQSFWLPRGWYYVGILSAGAPALRAASAWTPSPVGSSAGTSGTFFTNSTTFSSGMPASVGAGTIATTAPFAVFLRARL